MTRNRKIAAVAGGVAVVAAGLASGLTLSLTGGTSFDWQAAFNAAAPGDTITVPNGSYGDTTLGGSKAGSCRWDADWQDGTGTPRDLSGCVHFVPASPGGVTVQNLNLQGSNVYLDGINLSSSKGQGTLTVREPNCPLSVPTPIHDIVIANMHAVSFITRGMSYVSFVGDTFDHSNEGTADYSNTVGFCSSPTPGPYQTNHVLLDQDLIENVQWTGAGQHIECIHWWSADHVTIQRTQFLNCAQLAISLQGDSDTLKYVLIQNNVFDAICSHQSFPGGGCNGSNGGHPLAISRASFPLSDHITVRFNSFPVNDYGVTTSTGSGPFTDLNVVSNIIGSFANAGPSCQGGSNSGLNAGAKWDYNVFQNQPAGFTGCGTHSLVVGGSSSIYADPANFNYTLLPTSPAIGAAPVSVARPLTDLVGALRGASATDAGAYVFGAAPPPPPPTSTSTTTTTQTTPSTTTSTQTTTTVPPPAGLDVRECARTATVLTVCWTPVAGQVGSTFWVNGKRVSLTLDPTRTSVKFSLTAGAVYTVQALGELEKGSVTG